MPLEKYGIAKPGREIRDAGCDRSGMVSMCGPAVRTSGLCGSRMQCARPLKAVIEGEKAAIPFLSEAEAALKSIQPEDKEGKLAVAMAELRASDAELARLQAILDGLNHEFNEAKANITALEEKANMTKGKMDQVNKLMNGLAGEKIRWTEVSPLVSRCGK